MATESARHPSYYRAELPVDAAALALLRDLGADGRLSADHFLVRDGRAILTLNDDDITLLRELGLAVEVGADLLAQARRVREERIELVAPPGEAGEANDLQTGFIDQYLDVAGILARFAALHSAFPLLTEWLDLPHPTLGYDGAQAALHGPATVKLLRITTTPVVTTKPGLLLIAGAHAREWIPPLAAIEFAEQLLRTYTPGSPHPAVQQVNQLVEGLDILIVPALNPDGITFSHHDFAMWRKNRRPGPGAGACPGVDNNRNYSIAWGEAGSSGDPCSDSFRGTGPFSELENRNLRHLVEQFPNILTAIDCHSFGEDLFRPHPTGGIAVASQPVEPRDHAIYLTLEAAMNAAIATVSPGKTYSTGTTNNHAGTGDDYLFLAHRIFGFTMECAQEFQPPLADALVAIQEVAAALRALAAQTLTLAAQFTFPLELIQVVDRSGSMVAAGYAAAASANARRLVDLASPNDALGVVSFNATATTHLPRTPVTNPGVYATARAAVDAITFGGQTSIGAGLQAAATILAGAGATPGVPQALVLLSDGYQNRPPLVAAVLPTLPNGVKVHTIALGPQSDQALLQSIAATTGGTYAFSPDELELHEIYNAIRADATGEQLSLNETLALPAAGNAALTRQAVVDEGVATATFSVSWDDPTVELRVSLRPPQGPPVDLSRVRRTDGRAHTALRLRRPQAGVWSLDIRRGSGDAPLSCTAALFLRSDLHLRLVPAAKAFSVGKPVSVLAQVIDHDRVITDLRGVSLVAQPAASLQTLIDAWPPPLPRVPASLSQAPDALPRPVLQALLIRERLRRQTQQDPLRHLRTPAQVHLPTATALANLGHTPAALHALGLLPPTTEPTPTAAQPAGVAVVTHTATDIPGTYTIKVRIEGRSATGQPFIRVASRSLLVT